MMLRPRALYQSTVGKKVIMAATGLVLVGFVILHVAGNLLVFQGAEAMNAYAAFIKRDAAILWTVRAVLLAAVVLHIWSALGLTQAAYAARPVAYARKQSQAATLMSRTMRVGGVVLLLFIVFHLLHFTTGTIRPAGFSEKNVYENVVHSFAIPWVAAVYIVGMIALGMHLAHGTWAAFRTLGFARPGAMPARRRAAIAFGVIIWAGFTLIPVAVLAGLLT